MRNLLKTIIILLVLSGSSFAKSDDIILIIDGQTIPTQVSPKVLNGRTLVPIRTVSESLDAKVGWNQDIREVTLNFESLDLIIKMEIDSSLYYINGELGQMDTAPKIVNGHTLVPIRFISESLGLEVEWEGKSRTIYIYSERDKFKQMEKQMVDLVNKEREKNNLPKLKVDVKLQEVARLKSKDFDENNYFDHKSPRYGSPFDMMKNFGIEYTVAAENIAGNQSVEQAHIRLMNSKGHRENILRPELTHIGIGIAENKTYKYGFTQLFIRR